MAKQRYTLDTRVLTAFFFAAMPFVAFGSFIVVNQAKNQLRESVGVSLEQRAVQTKLALEQYVGEQVVQLRVLALDPDVQRALAAPARPVPEADARQIEQAWASGKDAKLNASLLESPLAARLKPLGLVRPSVKQVQIVDTSGRVLAASSRGGRLFHAESEWFKDLAAQEGEPEVHLGQLYRAPGSTVNLLEIAFPVRNRDGRLARGRPGALRRERSLHGARSRAHRPHGPRLPHPLDRRHGPRLGRERAHPQDAVPGLRLAAQRGGGLPPGRVRPADLRRGRDRAGATGRSPT